MVLDTRDDVLLCSLVCVLELAAMILLAALLGATLGEALRCVAIPDHDWRTPAMGIMSVVGILLIMFDEYEKRKR